MRYSAYALAEDFDQRLGDPADPARAFSFARCAELDRREEFPDEICRELDTLGVPSYYVPAEYGGAAYSYESLFQLVRMIARRDLTVVIAHTKTYLGAVAAWVGAERGQARRIGAEIIGGAVVSLGLTEREHGSDLLAGELSASPTSEGYSVSGEKWLINNASRGHMVCVLARTDSGGGPRGFSLLMIDKRRLPAESYRCTHAMATHGIRGADISGIRFSGAPVAREALIGAPGAGLEIVLKGLQLTRTLCTALSLGAADQALRIAVRFALEHRQYGRALIDLPKANRTLAEAYADLLTAEVVTLLTSRGTHALTAEMSVISAIVKFWVPTRVDAMIRELGQFLGARAYLTEAYADGVFQKVERDHRIVSIFDGNTVVNLNALINQFPALARGYQSGLADSSGVACAAGLTQPLPGFERDRLTLVARAGCSIVQSLPACVEEVRALAKDGMAPTAVAEQASQVLAFADDLHARMAAHRPSARDVPVEDFGLAERYATCYAAAACLQFWLRNRTSAEGGLWRGALWLRACLARLLRPAAGQEQDAVLDLLAGPLLEQYERGLLFSPLPCRLAEGVR